MTQRRQNGNDSTWHVLVLPPEDMVKICYEKVNVYKMPDDSELRGYTYIVPKGLSWPTTTDKRTVEWNIKIPPTWTYKLRNDDDLAPYGREIELTPAQFLHVMFGGSIEDEVGTIEEEWNKGGRQ